jgi:hypothetical protein
LSNAVIGYEGRGNRLKKAILNQSAFFHRDKTSGEVNGVVTAIPFTLNGLPVKDTWYVGSQASIASDQLAGIRVLPPLLSKARNSGITHLVMTKSDPAAEKYKRYFPSSSPLTSGFVKQHLDTAPWGRRALGKEIQTTIAEHLFKLTQRYLPDGYQWLVIPVPDKPGRLEQRLTNKS